MQDGSSDTVECQLLSVDVLCRVLRLNVRGSMRSVVRCALRRYGADSAGIQVACSTLHHLSACLHLPYYSTICDGEVHLANHRPATLPHLNCATQAISSRRSITSITNMCQSAQLLDTTSPSAAVA